MNLNLPNVGVAMKTAADYAKDLGERAVKTAVQTFIGSVVITEVTDKSMWLAAAAAGIGAGLSVLTSAASRLRGDKNSASLAKGV